MVGAQRPPMPPPPPPPPENPPPLEPPDDDQELENELPDELPDEPLETGVAARRPAADEASMRLELSSAWNRRT